MKNLRWCLTCLVILVLSAMVITGCDGSQSDYDAVNFREFSSSEELEDWLHANDVSEKPDIFSIGALYSKALEIQHDALLDGYIVSVDSDYERTEDIIYVFCTTVIEGYVWYWDPQTDEVFEDTHLGKVE